jgi:hypothetical protein
MIQNCEHYIRTVEVYNTGIHALMKGMLYNRALNHPNSAPSHDVLCVSISTPVP